MLRIAGKLLGYALGAKDGGIGRVRALCFDDGPWTVRCIVAHAGSWLTGKNTLVSPAAVARIDENCKTISTSFSSEQAENSPPVDTGKPILQQYENDYEAKLFFCCGQGSNMNAVRLKHPVKNA